MGVSPGLNRGMLETDFWLVRVSSTRPRCRLWSMTAGCGGPSRTPWVAPNGGSAIAQACCLFLLLTALFFIIEWFGREQQYAIAHLGSNWYKPARWAMYYAIIFAIFYFTGKEQQFIYFQF